MRARTRAGAAFTAAAVIAGCGGVSAPSIEGPSRDQHARASEIQHARASETTSAPREVSSCTAPPRASGGGGVLSSQLVAQLADEASAALAEVVCGCARAHGLGAPARVRVATVLVPGRGGLESARAVMESAAADARDWRGFQGCVDATARATSMPVHVIGSDVVPDLDPTDERVMMTLRIDLR